ncbi:MAG: hypothetical protein ACK5NB_04315 [Flavobacteriaceae bacterium]
MKRYISLSFLLLTALTLFILACNSIQKGEANVQNFNTTSTIAPKQIIDIDQAVAMFENEKQVKRELINPTLRKQYKNKNFQDTEFAWFSLDEMRQYINYIDAIQRENPNQNVSGIRIYFGRYNSSNSKKYQNQQAVFLVPTVENKGINSKYENLNHLPFAILPNSDSNPIKGAYSIIEPLVLDTKDKKERIKKFMDNSKDKQKASFSFYPVNFSATRALTSVILNEGEMAPPPPKAD